MSAPASVKPWYREVWPWLLMLPPFASVIGGVTMVYLAVGAPEALVVDDYARIEEITRERLAADRRAAELALTARVTLKPSGEGEFAVLVELGGAEPAELSVRLRHAAYEAADRRLVLERGDGPYQGRAELAPGRYDVEIEPADGSWRLAGQIAAGAATLGIRAGSGEAGR